MKEYKVCVMLSSYNGELYIKEQVKSILNQKNVDVKLLIRDDGSRDCTALIIKELEKSDSRIKCILGNNLGFANSFYELLKAAPESDYYAFSDQDDVWLDEKLIRTISGFVNENVLVSFCNAYTTDEKLNTTGSLYDENFKIKNKYTSFDDCIAHGCLLAFSKKAKDILLNYVGTIPVSHDVWVCSICSFVGQIVYVPQKLSLFRRHEKATTFRDNKNYLLSLLKKVKTNKRPTQKCAQIIMDSYKDYLSEVDQKYFNHVINYSTRLKDKVWLLFSPCVKRHSIVGTLKLKLKIIFNAF